MSIFSDILPPGFLESMGHFLFKWRNLLMPAILIVLLAGFPPSPFLGNLHADWWLDATGMLLAVLGQGLRAITIGNSYIIRGGKRGQIYAEGLVTTGMYAHSRNPLYLGNLLILTGIFVIHNNPWVYAIGLPTFLFFYVAIVAAEEEYLRNCFGLEYEVYCRRVPRWIPSFSGVYRSLQRSSFSWEYLLYTEYGSTCTWIGTLVVLLIYKLWIAPPFPYRTIDIITLWNLFFLIFATWFAWRYWKRWLRARRHRIM